MGDQSKDIILSIRGMSKSFGRNRVLDHINLDVRKGTVMGLMGENGAGKSTMMKWDCNGASGVKPVSGEKCCG